MFDLDELAVVDPHADEATLVARIDELERVKSAAAAGQARAAAALDERRRTDEAAAGVPAAQRGRGVASEVGLARRDSPARGSRYLSVAKALVHDMPHTLAALECGALSEWRATLIVRETAGLSVEDRAVLDAELCADVGTLDGLGDKRISAAAKQIAHRLDAQAVRDRAVNAEADRRVTIRPAPDALTYVTALSPASGRYPQPRPGRGSICRAEPGRQHHRRSPLARCGDGRHPGGTRDGPARRDTGASGGQPGHIG